MPTDVEWMQRALALARTGLGRVWPNPAVGCVVVREGQVVGQACTGPGGRPHAESLALQQAGPLARGATAYVSLEPCDHFGVTPPCTGALCQAGIARVVVAVRDPDPRVDGGGIARLRAAGLQVDVGVCEAEALSLNAGFFTRVRLGRPRVVVAPLPGGEARGSWLTGSGHDALASSLGAADPAPAARGPLNVRVDLHDSLASLAEVPATTGSHWLLASPRLSPAPDEAHATGEPQVLPVARRLDGGFDLQGALGSLGGRGLTSIVVDAADPLAALLLAAGLVDEESR